VKVALWGAGNIGQYLAPRLCTSPVVTELVWINRTVEKVRGRCIDLEQGLALAPTCFSATARAQDDIGDLAATIDLLILTQGDQVRPGTARQDSYASNCAIYEESVLPFVSHGDFNGIVLVLSNPVDLMTRLVALWKWHAEAATQTIGLGTVVETARLRGALAGYLPDRPPARTLWPYAIGTHDKCFVAVAQPQLGPGLAIDDEGFSDILEACHSEVVNAPKRIKKATPPQLLPDAIETALKSVGDAAVRAAAREAIVQRASPLPSTLFPVCEGAMQIVAAIGHDTHEILTVSTLDTTISDALCYSLPAIIGSSGVIGRGCMPPAQTPERYELDRALDAQRMTIQECAQRQAPLMGQRL
jgi:malate/lactate dehydrogenase